MRLAYCLENKVRQMTTMEIGSINELLLQIKRISTPQEQYSQVTCVHADCKYHTYWGMNEYCSNSEVYALKTKDKGGK